MADDEACEAITRFIRVCGEMFRLWCGWTHCWRPGARVENPDVAFADPGEAGAELTSTILNRARRFCGSSPGARKRTIESSALWRQFNSGETHSQRPGVAVGVLRGNPKMLSHLCRYLPDGICWNQISILQVEFSLTQVLDRPLTGRVLFEEVIRETGSELPPCVSAMRMCRHCSACWCCSVSSYGVSPIRKCEPCWLTCWA